MNPMLHTLTCSTRPGRAGPAIAHRPGVQTSDLEKVSQRLTTQNIALIAPPAQSGAVASGLWAEGPDNLPPQLRAAAKSSHSQAPRRESPTSGNAGRLPSRSRAQATRRLYLSHKPLLIPFGLSKPNGEIEAEIKSLSREQQGFEISSDWGKRFGARTSLYRPRRKPLELFRRRDVVMPL